MFESKNQILRKGVGEAVLLYVAGDEDGGRRSSGGRPLRGFLDRGGG